MNGKVDGGNVGDIKAIALVNIPSYGWLECNGQSVLRTDYPLLYNYFNNQTQTVDGTTKSLLNIYGYKDTTHFNLPDYQEVALVGVGTNSIDKANGDLTTSDIYTVGEFKDDQLMKHTHGVSVGNSQSTNTGACMPILHYVSTTYTDADGTTGRFGTTTHGKQKGVKYIIKVL